MCLNSDGLGGCMEEAKAMEAINECFSEIGRSDARAKIDPCSFAIAFIMSFIGDSKTHSLEAIRRSMMAHLGEDIQRHSFWERLSRKRLRNILADLVEQLMAKISQLAHFSKSILSQLGVSEILLIDSTSISLWDGSADDFPGTRTKCWVEMAFLF